MQIQIRSFGLVVSLSLWPAFAPAIPVDELGRDETIVFLYIRDPIQQAHMESLGVHRDPQAYPKPVMDANPAAFPVLCGPSSHADPSRSCRLAFVHESGNSYSQTINGVKLNFEAEGLPALPDAGTLSVTLPDSPESKVEIDFPSDKNSIITIQQGVKFGFVDPV